MNKTLHLHLAKIQLELKAPKGQRNAFGNYNYRSCEDILEAVKPLLGDCVITVGDEIVLVGDRYYVKATATFTDGVDSISNSAYARESLEKKGMDSSQVTGATSSYARKYALNGLLLIDDTKDADTMDNTSHSDAPRTVIARANGSTVIDQVTKPLDESIICPDHNCSVPKRISKSGTPYWGCTADPIKMHFLDHPNKADSDQKSW